MKTEPDVFKLHIPNPPSSAAIACFLGVSIETAQYLRRKTLSPTICYGFQNTRHESVCEFADWIRFLYDGTGVRYHIPDYPGYYLIYRGDNEDDAIVLHDDGKNLTMHLGFWSQNKPAKTIEKPC